jgi:lipopolysaccharide transport system permease protein
LSSLISSLRKNQRLLKDLVLRDLKARYVGSSMGFFWSVVFPVINLFVYMFVFRIVLNVRWEDHQGPAEVGLLMVAGIMVWQAFAESLSRMTNTLVENSNLIQKVVFPAEVLPVYLTVSALINMLIGLAVAILGVVWFAYIAPEVVETASTAPHSTIRLGVPIVVLPLLIVLQLVFMLGLGYFLSAFNLFLRDTYHVIGVFLTVWMFATPIVYPDFQVVKAGFGWLLTINPMHWLIDGYRKVLLYGAWPDWGMLGWFTLVALLVLLAGSAFFMAQKPRFPDLL